MCPLPGGVVQPLSSLYRTFHSEQLSTAFRKSDLQVDGELRGRVLPACTGAGCSVYPACLGEAVQTSVSSGVKYLGRSPPSDLSPQELLGASRVGVSCFGEECRTYIDPCTGLGSPVGLEAL